MEEKQKKGPDKNTLIAILLCAGIWIGWQMYLEKKYPESLRPQPTAEKKVEGESKQSAVVAQGVNSTTTQGAVPTPVEGGATAKSTRNHGLEKNWKYEDANWSVVVSSWGGRISEVILKKYTDRDAKPVALVRAESPGALLLDIEGEPAAAALSQVDYEIHPLGTNKVELTASNEGVQVKKTLTIIPEKYTIEAESSISGRISGIKRIDIQASALPPEIPPETGVLSSLTEIFNNLFHKDEKSGGAKQSAVPEIQEYFFSHGAKTDRLQSTVKDRQNKNFEQTHFASLGSRYFTSLLFNRSDVLPVGQAIATENASVLRFSYPVLNNSGDSQQVKVSLYAGPKVLSQMQQVDDTAGQVVDYGHFSWIAVPLLNLMKLFFDLFKNWGAAIIALTILVRLITYPFTYMSYKSMKGMQRIQPEMARIKETYKSNPQMLNQETMKLMRENKVNPMGGCLPVLLQLPVFWALYTVLQNSIELYHSPFIFWIHDLSLRDPFFILPILMATTMVIQQKITPNTMDPAQARMMLFMPIFFGFLMMNLPSGLTLYIFVSTLFGIIQQMIVMKDRSSGVTVVGAPIRGASK